MSTFSRITKSEAALTLKEIYKNGCIPAYEGVFYLLDELTPEEALDITNSDDFFIQLFNWFKE